MIWEQCWTKPETVIVDGFKISFLFYADDLILLEETEEDLQNLFNCLTDWRKSNGLYINKDKTKVIHFRTQSKPHTNFTF